MASVASQQARQTTAARSGRFACVLAACALLCACASDVKQTQVTDANQKQLLERVRGGKDLTGEESRLLLAHLARQADGKLPVGRTIADLIAEQRGFEQAATAAATPPPVAPSPAVAETAGPAVEGPTTPYARTSAPRARRERPLPSEAPGRAEPPAPSERPVAAEAPLTAEPPAPSEPPAAARATPAPEAVLPTGTIVQVRLEGALSTRTNRSGDVFWVSLSDDLAIGGQVLARRGDRLQGRVVTSLRSGKVKGRAQMTLELVALEAGGALHDVATEPIYFEAESSKGADAKKVGIGAGAGAIIGAITGGGKGAAIGTAVGAAAGGGAVLVTHGEDVELGVEKPLEFRLAQALRLRPAGAR